jgi:hypothetical protein
MSSTWKENVLIFAHSTLMSAFEINVQTAFPTTGSSLTLSMCFYGEFKRQTLNKFLMNMYLYVLEPSTL